MQGGEGRFLGADLFYTSGDLVGQERIDDQRFF